MAIPMNTIDLDQAALATEAKFAEEIGKLEDYVFSYGFADRNGVESLHVTNYATNHSNANAAAKVLGFIPTAEHMNVLIENIKRANYVVYAYEYHNGHYGTTEVRNYFVTRTRLGASDRVALGVQEEYTRPWGPGREQHRGYIV